MVLNIRILTAEKVICSTTVDQLILPTLTGLVGILDGHASLITGLEAAGLLRIKVDKTWTPILLFGGIAEIEGNKVTILTNNIEDLTNVELDKARKELEEATLAAENVESKKSKLDASLRLKKATARFEGVKYLSENVNNNSLN